MLQADLSSIRDDSNNLRFTRLSTLGGFGGTQQRTVRAFKTLETLISSLTAEHLLVVDCSHFEPLTSQTYETVVNLFTTVANRPTILLRHCNRDFVAKYEMIAAGFRERDLRLPRASTILERALQKRYVDYPPNLNDLGTGTPVGHNRFTNQIEDRSDYLVVPRDTNRPSEDRILAALDLENLYLAQTVGLSTHPLDLEDTSGRLRSTPLRSNHYVDCCTILGSPVDYIWLVSRIATDLLDLGFLLLDRHREAGLQNTPRLLACTRNGAALASAIQSFLTFVFDDNLRLDVVDRFGPTQRMVEEYDGGETQDSEGQKWYVYIGDVAIAGTELKIAEAHAHYRGVPLLGGLVVGSVLTFLEADDFGLRTEHVIGNRFSVFPLVHISDLMLPKSLAYEFP